MVKSETHQDPHLKCKTKTFSNPGLRRCDQEISAREFAALCVSHCVVPENMSTYKQNLFKPTCFPTVMFAMLSRVVAVVF